MKWFDALIGQKQWTAVWGKTRLCAKAFPHVEGLVEKAAP